MNDFDRASRCAVKECPIATLRWLLPKLKPSVNYAGWADAQSAPRPGEPDRRCDTIAQLIGDDGRHWAAVVELFTEPDGDAVDRALEYVGRFRRELRHGPHLRDKYNFAIVLVFLTGAPPETSVNANLPGMEEVGLWFGPRVVDLSAEDGLAHVGEIEQNRRSPGLLCWSPLMRGGQSEQTVRRVRALVEQMPEVGLRNTVVDLAIQFAELTGCREVWKKGLEGLAMNESISMREMREQGALENQRQNTLEALEEHFPGAVPDDVSKRILAEKEIARLRRWFKLAVKADVEAIRKDAQQG